MAVPPASVVLDVVRASECQNLRVIGFAIRDLVRILKGLEDDFAENEDAVSLLTRFAIAFSIEVHSGRVNPLTIANYSMTHLFVKHDSASNDDDETRRLRNAFSRYEHVLELTVTPSRYWWSAFFEYGTIDVTELNRAISERVGEDPPEWLNATYIDRLEDCEFEHLLESSFEKLGARCYRAIGPILHATGAHLWAVSNSLSNRSAQDIVGVAKAALDDLEEDEFFDRYRRLGCDRFESWDGTCYMARGTNEFIGVREHAEARETSLIFSRVQRKAGELIELLERKKVREFADALGVQNDSLSDVERAVLGHDVLTRIDAKRFCEAVLDAPATYFPYVLSSLNHRSMRKSECDWLMSVVEHIGSDDGLRRWVTKNRLEDLLNFQRPRCAG